MYCATCGGTATTEILCCACGLDPRLPKELLDIHVKRRPSSDGGPDIEYPGERTVLAVSLIATAAVFFVLTSVTIGLVALLIGVALVQLQFSERQLRDDAIRVDDRTH